MKLDSDWLQGALRLYLPYFEREDSDEFLYIVKSSQIRVIAERISSDYNEQWKESPKEKESK